MGDRPLVSILIPCRNAEAYVGEAVESALAQDYEPKEIIVVDDGSTDGSRDVLRRYEDDPRVTVIHQEHSGGNRARNVAFRASKGEIIQFLDADDLLDPDKISRQCAIMASTGADIVLGGARALDVRTGEERIVPQEVSGDLLNSLLVGGTLTLLHSYIVRRRIVEKIGGWDERIVIGQDLHFMVGLALASARYALEPADQCVYRIRPASYFHSMERRKRARSRVTTVHAICGLVLSRPASRLRRYSLAARCYRVLHSVFEDDREAWRRCLGLIRKVCPGYVPKDRLLFRMVALIFGLSASEHAAALLRRLRRGVSRG